MQAAALAYTLSCPASTCWLAKAVLGHDAALPIHAGQHERCWAITLPTAGKMVLPACLRDARQRAQQLACAVSPATMSAVPQLTWPQPAGSSLPGQRRRAACACAAASDLSTSPCGAASRAAGRQSCSRRPRGRQSTGARGRAGRSCGRPSACAASAGAAGGAGPATAAVSHV